MILPEFSSSDCFSYLGEGQRLNLILLFFMSSLVGSRIVLFPVISSQSIFGKLTIFTFRKITPVEAFS